MLLLILLLSACRRATTPEPTSTLSPTGTSAATVASPTKRPSSTATSFSTEVAAVPSASPSAITQLPVLSPTAAAPTGGAGPYPAPGLSTPPPPTGGAGPYPAPDLGTPTSTTSSGTPYPGPGTPLPTSTTSSGTPYPLPGSTVQSPTGTLAPTPGSQPTSSQSIPTSRSGTNTPAPGPGTPTPTLTQTGPTSYPGPGIPTQTKVPAAGASPTTGSPGPTAALTPSSTPSVVRARIQATDPRSFQVISGQPQLVEFFTYDTPVSKSMAPVVHGLEDRYKDRIRFIYLDLDDPANSLYKSMLKGKLPPFFYLLDAQGVLIQEWQGYVPIDKFESAFAAIGR